MSYKEKLVKDRMPHHVAVIMDGNGRWAKKKGNARIFGHKNGVNAVRETVEACGELQIDYLTLYAFSTENWNRPKLEVYALMKLLISSINNELGNLDKNNVKLMAIGNIAGLPSNVHKELNQAISATSKNTGLSLVLALSYSSRWEIQEAIRQIVVDAKQGKLSENDLSSDLISSYLTTSGIPDPDLLIRTSGELRISNFLLYQIAYSELYFTDTLWPDFCKEDLFEAIYNYQQRERRFGKTGEQINRH